MSDFETHEIGTAKRLERYHDALDHIERIARMSHQMSKRVYWIAQRAKSAIDGDEKWREFDYPRNRTRAHENFRQRNRVLVGMIKEALELWDTKYRDKIPMHLEIALSGEEKNDEQT